MHSQHEQLLATLFQALNAHNHEEIANCYHEKAYFQDIAFTLQGRKKIHAMWDFICSDDEKKVKSDIQAVVLNVSADEKTGQAVVCDIYTFRKENRRVANLITSSFKFQDGKIIEHRDQCDPVCWARQAIGGIGGFLAGHIGWIRRGKAMKTLRQARPEAFNNGQ